MKKTISITLAGRIFAIEEDGYEKLNAYLNGLKRHFAKDGSTDELMRDIEDGIAEKFSERLGPHKEAITIDDVDDVISVMGRIEDIAGEEGVDAAEEKSEPDQLRKRLYRDSDDMVIAGVCSGLAAYLGISPTVVRIAFIVLAFADGIGILAYLVLWVAVPLAKTNAQKLEMRGKPMNVDEIEQIVKEKAKKIGDDSTIQKILQLPVFVIEALMRAIRAIVSVIGPILATLVGIALLIGAVVGTAAASIIGAMMLFPTRTNVRFSDIPITEIVSQPLYYVGVISAFVLVLVPLILLGILATTLIRRKNAFRAVPFAALVGIWILAASAGAVAASDIVPWAHQRAQEIEKESMVTRELQIEGFTAIEAHGNIEVQLMRGDAYAVQVLGTSQTIDQFSATQTDGVLTLEARRETRGPCIFCTNRRIHVNITLPELTAYTAKGVTRSSISELSNDLVLNVEDAARVDITLLGQNVTSTINDVSRVTAWGTAKQFVATTADTSRLTIDGMSAESIHLTQSDVSSVRVQGTTAEITANLRDASRLDADGLEAERATITTRDVARSNITSK